MVLGWEGVGGGLRDFYHKLVQDVTMSPEMILIFKQLQKEQNGIYSRTPVKKEELWLFVDEFKGNYHFNIDR